MRETTISRAGAAGSPRLPGRRGRRTGRIALAALCAVVGLLYALPLFVLFILATGSPGLKEGLAPLFVSELRWSNFATAWQRSRIGLALVNSALITAGATGILVLVAGMAGFAISRFPTILNRAVFAVLLGCMMVPGIINSVPLYSLLHTIRGLNTRWAMMLILAANALPFAVFLYAGFVKTIPKEIEEAAIVDGLSWLGVFFRVTGRLLGPVTASVVILNGVGFWNNYGQAVFFLQRSELRTVPLAVAMFFQQYGAKWNLVAAAALIGVVPAMALFVAFQKSFVKGISAGAIK